MAQRADSLLRFSPPSRNLGRFNYFISFRGSERLSALRLREFLLCLHFNPNATMTRWFETVFIDWIGLEGGVGVFPHMYEASKNAAVFICLLTRNYFDSEYTRKEFKAHYDVDPSSIIALVEPGVQIPPNVRGIRRIDLRSPFSRMTLKNWYEVAKYLFENFNAICHEGNAQAVAHLATQAEQNNAILVHIFKGEQSNSWKKAVRAAFSRDGLEYFDVQEVEDIRQANYVLVPCWRISDEHHGILRKCIAKGVRVVPFTLKGMETAPPFLQALQGCKDVGVPKVNSKWVTTYVVNLLGGGWNFTAAATQSEAAAIQKFCADNDTAPKPANFYDF